MLTMGRPIQLKCARNVGLLGDLFGEKIRANYEQMQGHIDPVEILHFLSAPPEHYTAETGMTILVNQKNGEKRQNLEISLANNTLNRILVSGRMALTYQNRGFVENILKKLGVADVLPLGSLGRGEEDRRQITAEKVQETEMLRKILEDETMRVFETIRGYQENPERYPNVTASNEQAMNLLLRDIAAAGETQKNASKVLSGRKLGQSEKSVELFHRQNGQTVNEERLQEFLRTQRKNMRIQNTNVQKAFHEKTQVEEIVRSKVNEMKGRQEEEIVRLINQNVRRQLDTLSEKVYGKLEKRMDAERRRRGV